MLLSLQPWRTEYRSLVWELLMPQCTALTYFQFQQEEEFQCMKLWRRYNWYWSNSISLLLVFHDCDIEETSALHETPSLADRRKALLLDQKLWIQKIFRWLYCICPSQRNTPGLWFYSEFFRRNLILTGSFIAIDRLPLSAIPPSRRHVLITDNPARWDFLLHCYFAFLFWHLIYIKWPQKHSKISHFLKTISI